MGDKSTTMGEKRDRLVARLRRMELDAREGDAPNRIIIEHHRPEKPSSDGKILILDTEQVGRDERYLVERIRSAGGRGVILATNHGTPVSIVHNFSIGDAAEPGDPVAFARIHNASGDYGSSKRIEIRRNSDDQVLASTDYLGTAELIVEALNAPMWRADLLAAATAMVENPRAENPVLLEKQLDRLRRAVGK